MLAYILAIAVGLGSFALYMAAFFFPEVHRKYDFLWSGVGLFYALVLWLCAGRITGGLLLGQTAAVSLLGWLGWQTLTLRRSATPAAEKTEVAPQVEAQTQAFSPGSLFGAIASPFRKPKSQPPEAEPVESVATLVEDEVEVEVSTADLAEMPGVEDGAEGEAAPTEEREDARGLDSPEDSEAPEDSLEALEPEVGVEQQPTPPNPPTAEMLEAAQNNTKNTNSDAKAPIEEFAPEAELAPPADPHKQQDEE